MQQKNLFMEAPHLFMEKNQTKMRHLTSKNKNLSMLHQKMCEVMTKNYSNLYKFKSTALRFFTVYGPYGRPDMSPLIFLKSIYNNKKINLYNNGSSLRSYTYIDDVVNFIIKSIKNNSFLKDKKITIKYITWEIIKI